MSTVLWVIFWVLAVFVTSLICSLAIAAFIRFGGSGQSSDGFRDRGPAGGGAPPDRPDPAAGQRIQGEEPDTG